APIDELLNKAIEEVRNISHLKHPQMVKHLGLQTALEALIDKTFDESMTANVHVEDFPLPYEVQLFVYRAVQETTTNIIKHASATECIIRLSLENNSNEIQLLIRDDGNGFDAKGRNWRFGLRTLNEYCKSLEGNLKINSSAEDGTTLSMTLPNPQRTQL
ncbi:MAG: sensor histidine kinase, partial [Halioglobus sp.]